MKFCICYLHQHLKEKCRYTYLNFYLVTIIYSLLNTVFKIFRFMIVGYFFHKYTILYRYMCDTSVFIYIDNVFEIYSLYNNNYYKIYDVT